MNMEFSSRLSSVVNNNHAQATPLLERMNLIPERYSMEKVQHMLQRQFLAGVEGSLVDAILDGLSTPYPTQQDLAEILGYKDRTSISKIKVSGSMDGARIALALIFLDQHIKLPTKKTAALFGYAQATSYLKSLVFSNSAFEKSMRAQEFSFLIGILENNIWDTARRSSDPKEARLVANQIISEWCIDKDTSDYYSAHRPEQLVQLLKEIYNTWGEYGIVTLCSIPELIPVN